MKAFLMRTIIFSGAISLAGHADVARGSDTFEEALRAVQPKVIAAAEKALTDAGYVSNVSPEVRRDGEKFEARFWYSTENSWESQLIEVTGVDDPQVGISIESVTIRPQRP